MGISASSHGMCSRLKEAGGAPGGFSVEQIAEALKGALEEGAEFAAKKGAEAGGFSGNPAIAIPWPEECNEVKKGLEDIGAGEAVQAVVDKLNLAAEAAAAKSVEIFVDAVKNMSVDEAKKILEGEGYEPANTAATQYLMA